MSVEQTEEISGLKLDILALELQVKNLEKERDELRERLDIESDLAKRKMESFN